MKMLNIGCGTDIRPQQEGWINIDYIWRNGVDIVMNLNKDCLPFEDNSIDKILCSHVLEHVLNPYELVMECHRVLKKDHVLLIKLPCYSRGLAHIRYSHNESYFDDICIKKNPNRRSFQQEPLFKKIYVKHNGFTPKKMFWFIISKIRRLLFYEYEYKLTKE